MRFLERITAALAAAISGQVVRTIQTTIREDLVAEGRREEIKRYSETLSCGHPRRFLQFPDEIGPASAEYNFCVPCEVFVAAAQKNATVLENQALQDKMRLASLAQGFGHDGAEPLEEYNTPKAPGAKRKIARHSRSKK